MKKILFIICIASNLTYAQNFWKNFAVDSDGKLINPSPQVKEAWTFLSEGMVESAKAAPGSDVSAQLGMRAFINQTMNSKVDEALDFSKPQTVATIEEKIRMLEIIGLRSPEIPSGKRLIVELVHRKLVEEKFKVESNPNHFAGISDLDLPPQWGATTPDPYQGKSPLDFFPTEDLKVRAAMRAGFAGIAQAKADELKTPEEKIQFWAEMAKYSFRSSFEIPTAVRNKLMQSNELSVFSAFMARTAIEELNLIAQKSHDPNVKEAAYSYVAIGASGTYRTGDEGKWINETALDSLREALVKDTEAGVAGAKRGVDFLRAMSDDNYQAKGAIVEIRKVVQQVRSSEGAQNAKLNAQLTALESALDNKNKTAESSLRGIGATLKRAITACRLLLL